MLCVTSYYIESRYIENVIQCNIGTRHTGSRLHYHKSWVYAKLLPKYLQLRHQTVPTSRVYSWQQGRSSIDYLWQEMIPVIYEDIIIRIQTQK